MAESRSLDDLIELRDGSFAPRGRAAEMVIGIENIINRAIESGGIAEKLALEALVRAGQSFEFGYNLARYSECHERALQHCLGREAIVMVRIDPDVYGPEDPRRLVARRVIKNMVVVSSAGGDYFETQNPFADDDQESQPTE